MKKRFQNNHQNGIPKSSNVKNNLGQIVDPEKVVKVKTESEIRILQDENDKLRLIVDNLEKDKVIRSETIAIFEDKIKKVETEFFEQTKLQKKILDDKLEESKVLKGVIGKNKDEITKQKSENKEALKALKSKEKEIYNLGSKIENLSQTIKTLKDTNASLKNGKKKMEKKVKSTQKTFISSSFEKKLLKQLLSKLTLLTCNLVINPLT